MNNREESLYGLRSGANEEGSIAPNGRDQVRRFENAHMYGDAGADDAIVQVRRCECGRALQIGVRLLCFM